MQTPPFLEHLGLRADSDARDVKRAYARQLKQIDQEADPQAFQRLREAYESSLNWVEWHRRQREEQQAQEAAADEQAQSSAADEADGFMSTVPQRLAPEAPAASPTPSAGDAASPHAQTHHTPEAPTAPTPESLANAIFDECFSTSCDSESAARERLARALDDDRLIALQARGLFEWRVAVLLAEGWKPGHQYVWMAAVSCFGWDVDHTRLRQFGRAGHVLENVIVEQDFFGRQAQTRRDEQRRVMERLCGDVPPADDELAKLIPMLEWMIQTYPNWLWVATRSENVRSWRERHDALPTSMRAMNAPSPAKLEPAPKSSSTNPFYIVMLVVLGLSTFFRMIGSSSDSGSKYRYDPSTNPQVQTEMERVARQTQASLAEPAPAPLLGSAENATPFGKRSSMLDTDTSKATDILVEPKPIPKGVVASLSRGPRTKESCRSAATLAHEHGMGMVLPEPEFGPAFDSLVSDCVVRQLWPSSGDPAAILALKRDMARNQREAKRLLDEAVLQVKSTPANRDTSPSHPAAATATKPAVDLRSIGLNDQDLTLPRLTQPQLTIPQLAPPARAEPPTPELRSADQLQ